MSLAKATLPCLQCAGQPRRGRQLARRPVCVRATGEGGGGMFGGAANMMEQIKRAQQFAQVEAVKVQKELALYVRGARRR